LHALKSGSVQCAFEKHIPHAPVAVSQCLAEGLVQSPSAPQPHEWVDPTHAGPLALFVQSVGPSHPHA
jgi:hypothetical protein